MQTFQSFVDTVNPKFTTVTTRLKLNLDEAKHAHCTVAYLGELTDEKCIGLSELAHILDFQSPINVVVIGHKQIPKNANEVIEVSLLKFENPYIKLLTDDFYEKYGAPDPGHKEKFPFMIYHISENIPIRTVLQCVAFEAKVLGPYDPWFIQLLKTDP